MLGYYSYPHTICGISASIDIASKDFTTAQIRSHFSKEPIKPVGIEGYVDVIPPYLFICDDVAHDKTIAWCAAFEFSCVNGNGSGRSGNSLTKPHGDVGEFLREKVPIHNGVRNAGPLKRGIARYRSFVFHVVKSSG